MLSRAQIPWPAPGAAARATPPRRRSSRRQAAATIVKRGEYLARAGDCIACHTAPEGRTFAGGRAMPTPFGTLYTSNITPDRETGIGKWTADDFYTRCTRAAFPTAALIYPAMPFASYTKVTRGRQRRDLRLPQVDPAGEAEEPAARPELSLQQPRSCILGWRTLYFTRRRVQAGPNASRRNGTAAPIWSKGLGHCGMCHSPINALGGTSQSDAFKGGLIPMQNWYAPSLTSNREAGLGDWSIKDITDLLKTGSRQRGAVYGPMAEVVHNSLQYLTDEDTKAMAVYLKASPSRRRGRRRVRRCRRPRAASWSASARRSTTRTARVATARRARASRRTIRRSPATSRSRWNRPSIRSAWC